MSGCINCLVFMIGMAILGTLMVCLIIMLIRLIRIPDEDIDKYIYCDEEEFESIADSALNAKKMLSFIVGTTTDDGEVYITEVRKEDI